MTADDNRRLIRRYFEVVDRGPLAKAVELVDECVAEEYVAHMAGVTLRGRDALKGHLKSAYAAFSDMQHLVEDEIGERDKVVTRVCFRAIQNGPFAGIAASGRRIECPIIYIHRLARGRIHEAWLDWDSLFVMARQLGA
jgi:predicted ester cyclase